MLSIPSPLMKAQLRWPAVRPGCLLLPKQILFGELKSGKRAQCGQKKRYKDNNSLKSFINIDLIRNRATTSETSRAKMLCGIDNSTRPVSTDPSFRRLRLTSCPACHRVFRAQIGLIGHLSLRWWNSNSYSSILIKRKRRSKTRTNRGEIIKHLLAYEDCGIQICPAILCTLFKREKMGF